MHLRPQACRRRLDDFHSLGQFVLNAAFLKPEPILHAINGGGHNRTRAMLTGSLVGAQVGPSEFHDRRRTLIPRKVDYLTSCH